jgi:TM2 domain-containing membrane protein YozV
VIVLKKKSKFASFILSIVPGLAHIYLGFSARGAVFLASFVSIPILMSFIRGMFGWWGSEEIFIIPMFIVWLAAIADAMILVDRINGIPNLEGLPLSEDNLAPNYNVMLKQNKKVVAMFLSIIPGAGHLYLGLQRQGIELMAGFFLSFYLTDWLRISIFMMFAPIIWFSSMFDVMHKASGDRALNDSVLFIDKWFKNDKAIVGEKSFLRDKHKILGYVLVIGGVYLVINRFVYPFIRELLDPRITENIQTGFVAIILIIGGIKLIMGSKTVETYDEAQKPETYDATQELE